MSFSWGAVQEKVEGVASAQNLRASGTYWFLSKRQREWSDAVTKRNAWKEWPSAGEPTSRKPSQTLLGHHIQINRPRVTESTKFWAKQLDLEMFQSKSYTNCLGRHRNTSPKGTLDSSSGKSLGLSCYGQWSPVHTCVCFKLQHILIVVCTLHHSAFLFLWRVEMFNAFRVDFRDFKSVWVDNRV